MLQGDPKQVTPSLKTAASDRFSGLIQCSTASNGVEWVASQPEFGRPLIADPPAVERLGDLRVGRALELWLDRQQKP